MFRTWLQTPKTGFLTTRLKCSLFFISQVLLECAGLSQPLFVIQGSCLGMEISLDTDAIPFGSVVQRSQSSRKIIMSNTGDMNAKYVMLLVF